MAARVAKGGRSSGRNKNATPLSSRFHPSGWSAIFLSGHPRIERKMSNIETKDLVEELANGITHGIGLALSVVGLIALVALSIVRGNAWHIVGCTTFGVTLVL